MDLAVSSLQDKFDLVDIAKYLSGTDKTMFSLDNESPFSNLLLEPVNCQCDYLKLHHLCIWTPLSYSKAIVSHFSALLWWTVISSNW